MSKRILYRTTLAAVLVAAMPLASVTAVAATPAAQTQKLTNLKTRGAAEIDRRVAALTAAQAKLAASTKLKDADKTALSGQVQTELTALGALKTKLAADTELAMARTDVQAIVTDYRVYALMLPKARLVATTDRYAVAADKLTALQTKLQDKVTAAKSADKDVTSLQATLDDMKAKITASQTATATLVTKLLAIQPTDYNANHTVLTTYRETLVTAQTSLKTARTDASTVIEGLKALK